MDRSFRINFQTIFDKVQIDSEKNVRNSFVPAPGEEIATYGFAFQEIYWCLDQVQKGY